MRTISVKLFMPRPNLRSGPAFAVLCSCFLAVKPRRGFAIVHSVQSNHIHLIVEAAERMALLRDGTVFEDHYFGEQMKSPAQVRHTLRYIFRNVEHHSGRLVRGFDPRATEMYLSAQPLPGEVPVSSPRTWLLTVGWRRVRRRPWPSLVVAEAPPA